MSIVNAKYLRRLAGICFLSTFLFLPGCTDNFSDLNSPDNQLTIDQLGTNQLGQAFAQSQYRGMLGLSWQFQISQSLFSDLYSQYFATTAANFDSDQYLEVGRWIDLAWGSFYGDAAPQLDLVLNRTEQGTVEHAVAQIWRVQLYHRITDYWGPIIFSEFGSDGPTIAYDSQEEIYNSFFNILDQAVGVLEQNRGGNVFGSNDLVYAGDIDKWIRFANSLQLRLAMRVRYVDSGLAQTEAEEAVQRGVIEANGGNAMVLTTPNNRNPYFTITDWGEFRMSSAMESALEGYEDPRKEVYFKPAGDGDRDDDGSPYEGMRNGLSRSAKGDFLDADYSDMGTRWLNANRGGINPPMPVMRAAEVYFLRAEGALQGWSMDGSAKELYNQGIRMSLSESRIGASPSDIDAYVSSTNTPVKPNDKWESRTMSDIPVKFMEGASNEKKLEQIITQKWLAIYPDGWEAFAEYRRTGYPRLYSLIGSINQNLSEDDIFRRMTFVSSERANNGPAVQEAQGMLNGEPNNNATRVWWDAKPLSEFPPR